jgi:hypothetical protein
MRERMLITRIEVCLCLAEEAAMESAVIVSAVRTPVGSFGGLFKDVPATALVQRVLSSLYL